MGNRWWIGLMLSFVLLMFAELAVPAGARGADIRVVLDARNLTFDVPPPLGGNG
ncbi:MAG TPA: hypothetical protein VGK74_27445 [Symbiobacteriaceae bacterium]